jgi:hypothetical protein
MTTAEQSEFAPFRVVTSTADEFTIEIDDGKPYAAIAGMVCVLGLIALFFAQGTIYEKSFYCLMGGGFLIWMGMLLRHAPAHVSVRSSSGVHIKTRGPWAGEFHIEREGIQCLQIRLQMLPRLPKAIVWATARRGPRIPIIGFMRPESQNSLSCAQRFAEEFIKRIPVPIVPYGTQ